MIYLCFNQYCCGGARFVDISSRYCNFSYSVYTIRGCLLEQDVVVGEKSSIETGANISKTVIGRNCSIGMLFTISQWSSAPALKSHIQCQNNYFQLKPWPNILDFSLYNARHSCIVKCRERLATLYSEVERVLLCIVKFDQSQIFERCRVLSRAFGHPTIQSRAHARAVAAVFYIIG